MIVNSLYLYLALILGTLAYYLHVKKFLDLIIEDTKSSDYIYAGINLTIYTY